MAPKKTNVKAKQHSLPASAKKPLHDRADFTKMSANKRIAKMHNATAMKRTSRLLAAVVAIALISGCSMFSWTGIGGGKKNAREATERYDDAPITEETGSIPGDRSNATYSDEDLKAE